MPCSNWGYITATLQGTNYRRKLWRQRLVQTRTTHVIQTHVHHKLLKEAALCKILFPRIWVNTFLFRAPDTLRQPLSSSKSGRYICLPIRLINVRPSVIPLTVVYTPLTHLCTIYMLLTSFCVGDACFWFDYLEIGTGAVYSDLEKEYRALIFTQSLS